MTSTIYGRTFVDGSRSSWLGRSIETTILSIVVFAITNLIGSMKTTAEEFIPIYETGGLGILAELGQQELRMAGFKEEDVGPSSILEPIMMIMDLGSRQPISLDLKSLGGEAASGSGASVPANASGRGMNISRDGNTVVGYLDNGFFTPYHAFRWTIRAESWILAHWIQPITPRNRRSRTMLAATVRLS